MIRRFILLMLLAWLPFQASAMPWLAFQCDQHDSGIHDPGQQHTGHSHDAGSGDLHAADSDDPDAANGVHTCCHHFSGVVLTLLIPIRASVVAGVAPRSPAHLYEFVPDLPKRPPLAHLV